MWTFDGLTFYEGDCRSGDRAASPPELAAIGFGVAKRDKAAAIGAAYASAIGAGLVHGGALYQIDAASQQRIAARALLARACLDGAEAWPEGFGWIAADNSRPTFTAAGFWTFAVAAQNRVTALTLNARDLKDALAAARTVAEVDAIDASIGWE